MVTGLLNNAGWHVNHKRVERIWRREELKVPQKQKSARLMRHWFEHNGARAALAEQRVVRASAARTSQSCVVL